ncbi:MAG: hypothetical protein LBN08_03385 [Lactobacillales bacterium]|jgi:hypothetical protein|nr:hypothetical protein [Lactobacillales bacterium]
MDKRKAAFAEGWDNSSAMGAAYAIPIDTRLKVWEFINDAQNQIAELNVKYANNELVSRAGFDLESAGVAVDNIKHVKSIVAGKRNAGFVVTEGFNKYAQPDAIISGKAVNFKGCKNPENAYKAITKLEGGKLKYGKQTPYIFDDFVDAIHKKANEVLSSPKSTPQQKAQAQLALKSKGSGVTKKQANSLANGDALKKNISDKEVNRALNSNLQSIKEALNAGGMGFGISTAKELVALLEELIEEGEISKTRLLKSGKIVATATGEAMVLGYLSSKVFEMVAEHVAKEASRDAAEAAAKAVTENIGAIVAIVMLAWSAIQGWIKVSQGKITQEELVQTFVKDALVSTGGILGATLANALITALVTESVMSGILGTVLGIMSSIVGSLVGAAVIGFAMYGIQKLSMAVSVKTGWTYDPIGAVGIGAVTAALSGAAYALAASGLLAATAAASIATMGLVLIIAAPILAIGWFFFMRVDQNYELPDEVWKELGLESFDFLEFEHEEFGFDEFTFHELSFEEFSYEGIEVKILRRGVISFRKVGYIFEDGRGGVVTASNNSKSPNWR